MIRTETEKEIPMCVSLPIEVTSPDQAFPFLNTTLADLGIDESAVKERVVWVDTKRTQVRSKSGKLKEKEVSVLEIRVKAQLPGQTKCQEVLYSTESHTDRLYCRSGITFLPWTHTQP
ncbi:forkhead box P1-like protein, partial [Clarias magur]